MRPSTSSRAVTIAFAAAHGGCFLTTMPVAPPPSCTKAGCADQVAVAFPDEIALPYAVVVQSDERRITFSCVEEQGGTRPEPPGESDHCTARDFVLVDFKPSFVTVEVTDALGAARRDDFAPAYCFTHPNGPDCAPTCAFGTIALGPDGAVDSAPFFADCPAE